MRIGMLTGGGDCPGLNAVIRAVVRKGEGQYGHNIVGYRHGWRGVMMGESIDLGLPAVRGLLPRGDGRPTISLVWRPYDNSPEAHNA